MQDFMQELPSASFVREVEDLRIFLPNSQNLSVLEFSGADCAYFKVEVKDIRFMSENFFLERNLSSLLIRKDPNERRIQNGEYKNYLVCYVKLFGDMIEVKTNKKAPLISDTILLHDLPLNDLNYNKYAIFYEIESIHDDFQVYLSAYEKNDKVIDTICVSCATTFYAIRN